jgi:hypothetical protein
MPVWAIVPPPEAVHDNVIAVPVEETSGMTALFWSRQVARKLIDDPAPTVYRSGEINTVDNTLTTAGLRTVQETVYVLFPAFVVLTVTVVVYVLGASPVIFGEFEIVILAPLVPEGETTSHEGAPEIESPCNVPVEVDAVMIFAIGLALPESAEKSSEAGESCNDGVMLDGVHPE